MLCAPQMEPRYYDGYVLEGKGIGVRFLTGEKIFLLTVSRLILNPPPLSFLSNGCWLFFSRGLRRLRREADHSYPSGSNVKNASSYIIALHTSS
jgi:hypothetical protein